MRGESDLFEIVDALGAPRRFARGLDGGKQQRNQDSDNGDHDQQLHQSETGRAGTAGKRRNRARTPTRKTDAHGCSYCYARNSHEYLGWNAGLDFETRIVVKHDAARLFREFLANDAW